MDDPNNTNNSPTDAGVGNRQAIFTPQPEAANPPETPQPPTTVNTAADITPPTPPASDATHPFLSNHPTQTFNTNTGDIILGGAVPKTKQNKRPIFIGVAIILACLAVVAVILMAASGMFGEKQVSTAEVRTKWNEFTTYLENGPEGARETNENNEETDDVEENETEVYRRDEDEWYIFNLDRYDLPNDQRLQYVQELQSRWQKVSDDISSNETFVTNYASVLKRATNFQLLDYYKTEILQRYAKNDENSVTAYILTLTPDASEAEDINVADTALRNYLLSYTTVVDFYKVHQCLVDGGVDENCSANLSENNDSFNAALDTLADKYRALQSSNIAVTNNLIRYTMQINNLLREDA